MRASLEVGAIRKIGSMPAPRSSARELDAFLGRIVDDEDAVDAGLAARRRRSARRRSARSDSHSPSARPASRDRARGTRAPSSSTCGQADAARQRPLARLLDHRAVGHRVAERDAELDHVGAGLDHRQHDLRRRVGVRVAGGDVGDQRLAAALAAARRRSPSMRLMRSPRAPRARVELGDGARCPCRRGPRG